MDTGSFPANLTEPGSSSSFQGPHHTRAIVTVALVNTAIGVHLLLPSAVTNAVSQDTPVVENGTWIWEGSTTIGNNVIDARLEGTPSGSQVDWEMYVTTNNFAGRPYDDFILYTATSAIGGGDGSWSLYYDIQGQGRTRVLDADYLRTGAQHELTFSIPDTNPNTGAHGASVDYLADGNVREFDYQEPTVGQNHFIEWDAATANGSITAWNYNNGERACWDENLDDTPCEPTL